MHAKCQIITYARQVLSPCTSRTDAHGTVLDGLAKYLAGRTSLIRFRDTSRESWNTLDIGAYTGYWGHGKDKSTSPTQETVTRATRQHGRRSWHVCSFHVMHFYCWNSKTARRRTFCNILGNEHDSSLTTRNALPFCSISTTVMQQVEPYASS